MRNTPLPTEAQKDAAAAVRMAQSALSFGSEHLSHEVTERLRVARMQALKHLKTTPEPVKIVQPSRLSRWLQGMPSFTRSMLVAPALFLAIFISQRAVIDQPVAQSVALMSSQDHAQVLPATNPRTPQLASAPADSATEVDAILQEQIPLQAYLDDGFNQYSARIQQETRSHAQKVGYHPQNGNN